MIGKNVNLGVNTGNIGDSYTEYNKVELDELSQILSQIQSTMDQMDITTEEREEAEEYLSVIKEEAENSTPRKHFIKTACNGLKKIVSSPNFWNLIDKLSSYFLTTIQK
ncbi:MAG: hypothetical protein NC433_07810 [Clostridiales bacterium]|nr:hypothetical protein [Clostridiales bacterium]